MLRGRGGRACPPLRAAPSALPLASLQGFKFFTPAGGFEKADIAELLGLAAASHAEAAEANPLLHVAAGAPPPDGVAHALAAALAASPVSVSSADFMPVYAAHLRSVIVEGVGAGDTPLAGLRIVVDAGNGAGGFLATDVLAPLGADVSGEEGQGWGQGWGQRLGQGWG